MIGPIVRKNDIAHILRSSRNRGVQKIWFVMLADMCYYVGINPKR